MDRKPIFEIPFFNRTYMDTQNHILPTINGNPEFRRGDKGFGLVGFAVGDGLSYVKNISNGTYSIVVWTNYNEDSPGGFFFDGRFGGGTGAFYLKTSTGLYTSTSGGTTYVNNIVSANPIYGSQTCVICNGMSIEATKVFLNVNNVLASSVRNCNFPYFAVYSGTFTAAERDELYQNFLDAPGPTSTPTIIRHHISVSGRD